MNQNQRIAKAVKKQIALAMRVQKTPATIVGAVSGRKGYVTVTMPDGSTLEVLNQRASSSANLQVWLGVDPLLPDVLQVLGEQNNFEQGTGYGIVDHHTNHEYPNHDTVWVQGAQFLPLDVLPAGGFSVQVYGDVLEVAGTLIKVANQTVDLSASQPATGARWTILQVDNAGTVTAVDGATAAGKTALTLADIPAATAGNYRFVAIMLYADQDEIQRNPNGIDDFVDLRRAGLAVSGYAGYGLAATIHAATASAISDDDEVGFWENVADALRKITWANIKATLKTYFETLFPRKYAGKAVPPTVNDDSGDGYAVGDRWLDETNDKEYVALDVTVGAAVWVEVGGGGGAVYDTEANILASTEDAGVIAIASDENVNGHHNIFVSLGAGAWMKMPFAAIPVSGDPDMGYPSENNLLGYGKEYITNKTLSNVQVGSNPNTNEGGFYIDPASASPRRFYMRLNGVTNTVMIDFSLLLGYLVHYPFSTTQAVEVWNGDSVELGLNGIPLVQEYTRDMGPNPAPRIIHGGLF